MQNTTKTTKPHISDMLSAREIHTDLCVATEFKQWFYRKRNALQLTEGPDFVTLFEHRAGPGHPRVQDYLLTRKAGLAVGAATREYATPAVQELIGDQIKRQRDDERNAYKREKRRREREAKEG